VVPGFIDVAWVLPLGGGGREGGKSTMVLGILIYEGVKLEKD
jgi:hypothetical protein